MPDVEIFGALQSTYVRVAWMTCEEKQAPYVIRPARPHSPEICAIHPFGRIPVMRHGQRTLFESKAIATYIDRAFGRPSLIPSDPYAAGLVEQWVSAVNTTMEPAWTHYFRAHVFPKGPAGRPDLVVINAQLSLMADHVRVLDQVLAGNDFLAGDRFTLADIALFPALHYLTQFPESGQLVADAPALTAYYERIGQRASVRASSPPPLEDLASDRL